MADQNKKPKELRRSRNRIIFGVCGGIGEYFDFDPTVVRLIFLLLVFANGLGVILYLLLALLMPNSPDGEEGEGVRSENAKEFVEDLERAVQQMAENAKAKKAKMKGVTRMLGAILILVGGLAILKELSPMFFIPLNLIWPVLVIGLGLYLLLRPPRGENQR